MLTFWTKYAYWLSIGVFAGAIVAASWYAALVALCLIMIARFGYSKGGKYELYRCVYPVFCGHRSYGLLRPQDQEKQMTSRRRKPPFFMPGIRPAPVKKSKAPEKGLCVWPPTRRRMKLSQEIHNFSKPLIRRRTITSQSCVIDSKNP